MHKSILKCNSLQMGRILNIFFGLSFLIFCNGLVAYAIRKELF